MTLDDFDKGMARLERMFNRGIILAGDVRLEYLHVLRFLEAPAFDAAVTIVIETFKPFPSEPFPSPVTIQDAVTMAQSEDQVFWARRQGAPGTSILDFCQLCRNCGLYLAFDGQAWLCRCEKGRIRRASWDVPYGTRKREAKIQDELDKLPPGKDPVRGLEERNAMGFWEPTAVEHDRWMAAKRIEIEEIKQRQAERPRDRREVRPESLRRIVEETMAQVAEAKRSREPGEDEEEEEVGF